MLVIFVHGWSVRHTDTYADLPRWLEQKGLSGDIPIKTGNIYLGKYISFIDTVTLDDIARAFDEAVKDAAGERIKKGERFACVTHSTGGPVVRKWIDLYHRNDLRRCPLSHLVMLAPANHGSALAQLGKSRLSRMKFFAGGVEPGERVLDWLELGGEESWELNESWLSYKYSENELYPFVLTGQGIDRSFYDNLNAYTGESGSDGVVRVASANMNYALLRLVQDGRDGLKVKKFEPSSVIGLGVLPGLSGTHGLSHSGKKMGIIGSVRMANADTHPTAQWVLKCLQVNSRATYNHIVEEFEKLTKKSQADQRVERESKLFFEERIFRHDRHCMLVFRLIDDRGNALEDYDLYLTAGPSYSRNDLPVGFFTDRQRNQRNPGKLTYYLNSDQLEEGLQDPKLGKKLGLQAVARPERSKDALRILRNARVQIVAAADSQNSSFRTRRS